MRLELTYRLDTKKAHERELLPIVDDLKASRSYARAIRIGLKIFWEAVQGRTDTLRQEFPQVVELLVQDAVQRALEEQRDSKLDKLEALLRERPTFIEGGPTLSALPDRGDSPEARPIAKLPAANNINNIDLEIKKTSKPVNAGRILILQVWLTSSEKNIELFKTEDLEMVTGHPAFNQTLIKAEIARRKKADKSPVIAPVVADPPPANTGGNAKQIKGADITFTAPTDDDFDNLL